jgi:hypothetical protein
MNFGAVAGHRYGRATPSLRDAQPQRAIPSTGRGSTYRSRNGVSTKPATSSDEPSSDILDCPAVVSARRCR